MNPKKIALVLAVVTSLLVILFLFFYSHSFSVWLIRTQREYRLSHLPMKEMLSEIDSELNPFYKSSYIWRASQLQLEIQSTDSEPAKSTLEYQLALTYLGDGATDKAITTLENLKKRIGADKKASVQELLALSYLRMGEQANCIHNHAARSCIFPLTKEGVHSLATGAQQAVQEYTNLLRLNPNKKDWQWMLNIAYMAAGTPVEKIPPQWRIPEKWYRTKAHASRFEDVAQKVGIVTQGRAGGVIAEDFNGDGLIDIMVSDRSEHGQLRYFVNQGDGKFKDRTNAAGLTGITGGLNIVQADYDNDGRPDVLVMRGGWMGRFGRFPLSLLHNNGDGTFEDRTKQAGLLFFHPTHTAAWADFDNDGWLDVFVGVEEDNTHTPSKLFHNNHDGTFTDVAAAVGLNITGWVKGAAWGDYDNDGLMDLYVTRWDGSNMLFKNLGKGTDGLYHFADVSKEAGVDATAQGFATMFLDYDNDGWPDLLFFSYQGEGAGSYAGGGLWNYLNPFGKDIPDPFQLTLLENFLSDREDSRGHKIFSPTLFHNEHNGTFKDVTKEAGLNENVMAMGAGFGDLDNDGWPDVYAGTGAPGFDNLIPNRMFRNRDGHSFEDVTIPTGLGHLQKGHGIAFADFNNDGAQDILVNLGGVLAGDVYQRVLFANPGNGNKWLKLVLEGNKSNRLAVGAKVAVRILDRDRHERTIYSYVSSGGSFGASPFRREIGLGPAARIVDVQIKWPATAEMQKFTGLQVNHFYKLTEGVPNPELLPLKRWKF